MNNYCTSMQLTSSRRRWITARAYTLLWHLILQSRPSFRQFLNTCRLLRGCLVLHHHRSHVGLGLRSGWREPLAAAGARCDGRERKQQTRSHAWEPRTTCAAEMVRYIGGMAPEAITRQRQNTIVLCQSASLTRTTFTELHSRSSNMK